MTKGASKRASTRMRQLLPLAGIAAFIVLLVVVFRPIVDNSARPSDRQFDCNLSPDQLPEASELPFAAAESYFYQKHPGPQDRWIAGIQREFQTPGTTTFVFAAVAYCHPSSGESSAEFVYRRDTSSTTLPGASMLDISASVGVDAFAVLWTDSSGRSRLGSLARWGNMLVQTDYVLPGDQDARETASTHVRLMLNSL